MNGSVVLWVDKAALDDRVPKQVSSTVRAERRQAASAAAPLATVDFTWESYSPGLIQQGDYYCSVEGEVVSPPTMCIRGARAGSWWVALYPSSDVEPIPLDELRRSVRQYAGRSLRVGGRVRNSRVIEAVFDAFGLPMPKR